MCNSHLIFSLGLNIIKVVATAQALTALVSANEAIVLDVGFSGTGIYVMGNGLLIKTTWVALGGNFFTQSLARVAQTTMPIAKEWKHALTAGDLTAQEAQWLNSHLDTARQRWSDAVLEALKPLALHLPRHIYLTGGGSKLPGLAKSLRLASAMYHYAPEVTSLKINSSPTIKNLVGQFDEQLFALAIGLGSRK